MLHNGQNMTVFVLFQLLFGLKTKSLWLEMSALPYAPPLKYATADIHLMLQEVQRDEAWSDEHLGWASYDTKTSEESRW